MADKISYKFKIDDAKCLTIDNKLVDIVPYYLIGGTTYSYIIVIDDNIKEILYMPSDVDIINISQNNTHLKLLDLEKYQNIIKVICPLYIKIINSSINIQIIRQIK